VAVPASAGSLGANTTGSSWQLSVNKAVAAIGSDSTASRASRARLTRLWQTGARSNRGSSSSSSSSSRDAGSTLPAGSRSSKAEAYQQQYNTSRQLSAEAEEELCHMCQVRRCEAMLLSCLIILCRHGAAAHTCSIPGCWRVFQASRLPAAGLLTPACC
jgi:hypothetical protein